MALTLTESEELELLELERQRANSGPQENPGLLKRGWDALAIPEQKSREGLQMLANMVPNPAPTGNLPLDMIKGAPRVAADTMAEAAPGFISRGALLTAGASKAAGALAPIAKATLRGLGKQGESLSGAMPGSLEAAFKDSSLMFGKGRKAAQQAYETAKGGEKITYGDNLTTAKKFFDSAVSKAKSGKLGPVEALEARKVADDLYESGTYVGDEIMQKRKILDEVAKKSFDAADKGFKRALQSESLRNLFPQNKYGGTSAFKLGIMTALRAMGPVGKTASMALSPVVQGATATAAGGIGRNLIAPLAQSPALAVAISEALKLRKEKSNGR